MHSYLYEICNFWTGATIKCQSENSPFRLKASVKSILLTIASCIYIKYRRKKSKNIQSLIQSIKSENEFYNLLLMTCSSFSPEAELINPLNLEWICCGTKVLDFVTLLIRIDQLLSSPISFIFTCLMFRNDVQHIFGDARFIWFVSGCLAKWLLKSFDN